jgi:hypothetical protein
MYHAVMATLVGGVKNVIVIMHPVENFKKIRQNMIWRSVVRLNSIYKLF